MNKKTKPYLSVSILLLFVLTCITCSDGGSDNGDKDDKQAGVETIRAGLWSGNANFGEVEFDVITDSSGIESFEVMFVDYTCGMVTRNGSISLIFNPKRAIVDRHIDLLITLGGAPDSDTITIEGTFESSGDSIVGTFDLESSGTVCSGTWDARPD